MKSLRRVLIRLFIIVALSATAMAQSQPDISPQAGAPQSLRIGVDQRVELMAIIFRLAGNREYNQGKLQPYVSDIDKHFGPHRDHPAVAIARELREKMGVGNDVVMYIAIHLNDPYELRERVAFDAPGGILDQRGIPKPQAAKWASEVRRFLEAARRFAIDSRAREFFAAHQGFYSAAGARLRQVIERHADLAWFNRFYGKPPEADFFVVPLLANSETNFGPRLPGLGVRPELYAILTVSKTDAAGVPLYTEDKVDTLVHEFSHSYVNPLVMANIAGFEQSGPRVFSPVADAMSDQGYGDWRIVIMESLVRAASARYMREHDGPKAALAEVAGQQGKGYLWMPGLYELLGEYEADRKRYPTLDSFLPRVVAFFDALTGKVEEMKRLYDARRPQVAALSIENGSEAVDPAITEIVVRFDRPMQKRSPVLMYDVRPAHNGRDRFPAILGQEFDPDGMTYRMTVKLEPDRPYEFVLSRPSGGGGFVSADGVPLAPYNVKFKTRPQSK